MIDLVEYFLAKNAGGGSSDITVEALNVTENGTYTADEGKAYSPVTVNVEADPLPTLTNPAAASDVTNGKEYIDGNGEKKTGTNTEVPVLRGMIDGTTANAVVPNITSIKNYYGYDDKTLKSITMPNVTTVGEYAFYSSIVEEVYLPEWNDTRIAPTERSNVFRKCSKLKTLIAPKLKGCGNFSFATCSSVRHAELDELRDIAQNGFEFGELTLIDFHHLTRIRNASFVCAKLTTFINRYNGICTLEYACFDGKPIGLGTGYIYVPADLIEGYKTATDWSIYASQIKALYIATSAEDRSAKLVDSSIPDGSMIIWDAGTYNYDLDIGTKYTVKEAAV